MIRQFGFTWTAISWLLMGYGLFFALSPLQAQTAIKKFSLELKNESLPEALKQLEKAGGKYKRLILEQKQERLIYWEEIRLQICQLRLLNCGKTVMMHMAIIWMLVYIVLDIKM